jgi:hypothetical protein
MAEQTMDQAIEIRVNGLGQAVGTPTAQQLQSLNSEQTVITSALAAGVSSDSLSSSITTYLSDVFQLIDATNHPAALQPSLVIGQQALANELLLHPVPVNIVLLNPIADQTVASGTEVKLSTIATDSGSAATMTYSLDAGAQGSTPARGAKPAMNASLSDSRGRHSPVARSNK